MKCEICGGYQLPELKVGDKVEYFKAKQLKKVMRLSGVKGVIVGTLGLHEVVIKSREGRVAMHRDLVTLQDGPTIVSVRMFGRCKCNKK